MVKSTNFYNNLPILKGEVDQIIGNESLYKAVPGDWNIIITDVKNSTKAISRGLQQEINLAATGSIVACLNIARPKRIEIPFFFGGDGATILIPQEITEQCTNALEQYSERCEKNFGFFLRVGYRNVQQLYDNGALLKVLRFQRNELHVMPVIQGNALKIAEDQIKQDNLLSFQNSQQQTLNLAGMECKWDKIRPPENRKEVMSFLINTIRVEDQGYVYAKILKDFKVIFGDDIQRSPLVSKNLKMVQKLDQIKNEVKMKYNKVTGRNLAASYGRNFIGRFYLKYFKKGKNYVNEMIQLTETLLLDGSINTIVSGNMKQREMMLASLDALEAKGLINYGFHSSKRSVISCYVTGLDDYHVHFLDGEDGGYTNAAKVLKAKQHQ